MLRQVVDATVLLDSKVLMLRLHIVVSGVFACVAVVSYVAGSCDLHLALRERARLLDGRLS